MREILCRLVRSGFKTPRYADLLSRRGRKSDVAARCLAEDRKKRRPGLSTRGRTDGDASLHRDREAIGSVVTSRIAFGQTGRPGPVPKVGADHASSICKAVFILGKTMAMRHSLENAFTRPTMPRGNEAGPCPEWSFQRVAARQAKPPRWTRGQRGCVDAWRVTSGPVGLTTP